MNDRSSYSTVPGRDGADRLARNTVRIASTDRPTDRRLRALAAAWRVLRGTLSIGLLVLSLCATPLQAAVEPAEMLADAALEARAREIGRNLRCVVCQNQSIDDSTADLARDMRRLVRERLQAGDSDRQVYDFMTRRYGDFVLLQPPFRSYTLLLWLGPALVLLLSAGLLWRLARRRARLVAQLTQPPAALASEDRERLQRLLER